MACNTKQNTNLILEKLNDKPQIVNNVIKCINSKYWNELKSLGVHDCSSIIMEASKVLTKINLVQQAQAKCNQILQGSELFMDRYKKLVNLGLTSCWNKNGNLIPQEAYKEMLTLTRNNETKFQDL